MTQLIGGGGGGLINKKVMTPKLSDEARRLKLNEAEKTKPVAGTFSTTQANSADPVEQIVVALNLFPKFMPVMPKNIYAQVLDR